MLRRVAQARGCSGGTWTDSANPRLRATGPMRRRHLLLQHGARSFFVLIRTWRWTTRPRNCDPPSEPKRHWRDCVQLHRWKQLQGHLQHVLRHRRSIHICAGGIPSSFIDAAAVDDATDNSGLQRSERHRSFVCDSTGSDLQRELHAWSSEQSPLFAAKGNGHRRSASRRYYTRRRRTRKPHLESRASLTSASRIP